MSTLFSTFIAFIFSQLILASTTVISGQPVYRGDYDEVFYVSGSGLRCSGTAVSKNVILTAAHCVENRGGVTNVDMEDFQIYDSSQIDGLVSQVVISHNLDSSFVGTAICAQHPYYRNGHLDYDYALCKTATRLPGPFASISRSGPMVGEDLLLLGYGLGDNRTLLFGKSTLRALPDGDALFMVGGPGSLYFTNTGGPAFRLKGSEKNRQIYGLNSRGDRQNTSWFAAVYIPGVRNWMSFWEKRHGTNICGISNKCREGRQGEKKVRFQLPDRDSGAHIDFESMLEELRDL